MKTVPFEENDAFLLVRRWAFFVGDGLARPVTINNSRIVWRWVFVFGRSKPLPYRVCALFVCAAVGVCCGRPNTQSAVAPTEFVRFLFVRWYAFVFGRSKPLPYRVCAFFVCTAEGVCFREEQAPPLQSLCGFCLCGGMRLFSGRRGAVPYGFVRLFSQI